MNRSEIRTAIRALLNESTPGFWTDAELNIYINLANKRVNSVISNIRDDWFTQKATFTCVSGQKEYTMPSGCRFIRRLEVYDSTDSGYINKLDEQRFPRVEANGDWPYSQTGQPKEYLIIGQKFTLLPTPNDAFQMRIYYDVRQPALNADSDSPDSPEEFHDLVVFLAGLYAKKQNEDDDSWYGEMYRSRLNELVEYLVGRGSDDPKTVEGFLEGYA